VAAGRRNEFARFARFNDPVAREGIPDPNAATTFKASKLDWHDLAPPRHQKWLSFYRTLLGLRSQYIIPRLSGSCAIKAHYEVQENRILTVHWQFPDNTKLTLLANLSAETGSEIEFPTGQLIYTSEEVKNDSLKKGTLPPWAVVWSLET
jgi:1,4-alpha-glucan branching enzyme